MPTPRYVLTSGEAKVLLALDVDGESSASELAAAAQLTPTRVESVARRLERKGLVTTVSDEHVRLSSRGKAFSRAVRLAGSGDGQPGATLIVPDDDLEPADIDGLDAAIDTALKKLKQD